MHSPPVFPITHINLRYILSLLVFELNDSDVDWANPSDIIKCLSRLPIYPSECRLYQSAVHYCFEHYGAIANSATQETYYCDCTIYFKEGHYVSIDRSGNEIARETLINRAIEKTKINKET